MVFFMMESFLYVLTGFSHAFWVLPSWHVPVEQSQKSEVRSAVWNYGGKGYFCAVFAVCFYGEMIHGLWQRFLPNYDMLY